MVFIYIGLIFTWNGFDDLNRDQDSTILIDAVLYFAQFGEMKIKDFCAEKGWSRKKCIPKYTERRGNSEIVEKGEIFLHANGKRRFSPIKSM